MDRSVILGGIVWYIGEVRRDRCSLAEQEESLREEYEGYDMIGVSHGVIRFYYRKRKEGVA